MSNHQTEKTKVLVIGAGPAGMMAAGAAAENGADVVIVEKNPDSNYKADVATFFQVDCRAKLFSVRCVEGE